MTNCTEKATKRQQNQIRERLILCKRRRRIKRVRILTKMGSLIQSVSPAVKDELCCFQKKISILVPWSPLNWRNLVALSGFCWAECESGGAGAAPAPGTEGRTRKFGCTRGIHQILAQQKRLAICPRNNIRQHRKKRTWNLFKNVRRLGFC